MARITVEDCLQTIGESKRFDLVHLTVERIRQHRHGEPYLVEGKNKEVVMTLREVAAGKVNFENIWTLPDAFEGKPKKQESVGQEHTETAA
ncbi:MAG: DNA-directed RNA polymerase subunit omega [Proteobacteria bacterium]|nr:DNA-directed RNA polymerase subunit omega [Pseudomonadota bacterium]MBU1231816.1 DNA-directed RNA polymerase subunit omega [Pseudomonadota bacterium]MBU1419989.1 DNA-directed RNA polymerase subunit omega [Pseudomonadota bacterium]MBU1454772.1 DNA-directed RNA polymerase subunit omega [Pseudomonadota bacterium]